MSLGGSTRRRPVRPCNHYTRAASHLDPGQSSLFHFFERRACLLTPQIKKAAIADGPSNLFAALFVQAACAFRFLRQPSRPNAPRCRFRPEASPAEGCLAKRRHVSIAGDTAARSPAGMTHSVKALISAGRWIVGMEPRCAARSAQFIFRRRRCADAAFHRRRCPAADFRRRRCPDSAA